MAITVHINNTHTIQIQLNTNEVSQNVSSMNIYIRLSICQLHSDHQSERISYLIRWRRRNLPPRHPELRTLCHHIRPM